MKISLIDEDVIHKIRKCMRSTHRVIIDTRGKHPQYILQICSEPLYDDLVKLGVTPRKSRTVKMPEVPAKFFPDFARGVFEGDGSYEYDGRWKIRVKLTSSSPGFIKPFAARMADMGLKYRAPYEYRGRFELSYGAVKDCLLYYELLYKKTPKWMTMDRKRQVIEEWYKWASAPWQT